MKLLTLFEQFYSVSNMQSFDTKLLSHSNRSGVLNEFPLHEFKHKVLPYLRINLLSLGLIFAGLILLKQNNLLNTTTVGWDEALCCSRPNCLRHDTTIYSSSTPIPPPTIVCVFTFSSAFPWKGYENNYLRPLSPISKVFDSAHVIVTCRIRKQEQLVL